jgi:hypothetical protein
MPLRKPGQSQIETHIENRRLFDMAAGRLRLEVWEQKHLHECEICQSVLCVFLNQPVSTPIGDSSKSDAA